MALAPCQGTCHPAYKNLYLFVVFIPYQCEVHHLEVNLDQMTLKVSLTLLYTWTSYQLEGW